MHPSFHGLNVRCCLMCFVCALHVFLCAFVFQFVCLCTCAQLRGTASTETPVTLQATGLGRGVNPGGWDGRDPRIWVGGRGHVVNYYFILSCIQEVYSKVVTFEEK